MRRSIFDRVRLEKNSGVICLEMMRKIEDAGFTIVEVPVHHYHRAHGKSQFFNFPRIFAHGRRRSEALVRAGRARHAPIDAATPPTGRSREDAGAVMPSYLEFYRGRRVMITGGLGFIGSNIAHRLVELGAEVLLMDSLIPDSGANFFNIDGIADKVRVNIADVRQESTMNHLVRDREVIFNLAGQVSHIDSMADPYTDLDINCRSQLSILEACRKFNPRVKVVFAGTRQVYGKPDTLPVTEDHLVPPGRRQRHQQGRGRELSPALQQRVQRPRVLAAADERVRTSPAHQAQPAGLHRLVHPSRTRRAGD